MKNQMMGILLFFPFLIWGQTFDSVVDFDLDLSALNDRSIVSEAVKSGKIAILEGFMGDIAIFNENDETEVWVTLIGGEWVGTKEVRAYSCRILFRGEQWLEVFPPVRPREPIPEYVPQGSHLLIVARLIGYDTASGVPLAEMIDYRILN